MANARELCTCTSLDCPNHPANHDQGCTPCIEKNLRTGEIPGCFFNKVSQAEDRKGYFFRDFAEAVLNSAQE